MSKSNTIYFPGLNGIRAIAALIVIIWHIDQFMPLFNLPRWGFYANDMSGHGVNLFFVLSGFLITFLLLKEKDKTQTINIKNFYIRRMLRIWPLYYLCMAIALFLVYVNVIPAPRDWFTSLFFYTFLMANVNFATNHVILAITPLWSVGVEEQYYLFWPLIIKKIKNPLYALTGVIIIYLLIKLTIWFFAIDTFWYSLITGLRVDLMALGGLGAMIIFYKKEKIKRLIFHKSTQLIAWGVLLISIFYKPIHVFSFIDNEVNSLFYLILILNVSSNPNTIITLENKFFNHIGRLSYGLYVYHMAIIFTLSFALKNTIFTQTAITPYLVLISILAFTYLISFLSFKYIETPILKLKGRFSTIESTTINSATI
jgi:peptidoglycan/LPS O-acetylase OafA/YrhL